MLVHARTSYATENVRKNFSNVASPRSGSGRGKLFLPLDAHVRMVGGASGSDNEADVSGPTPSIPAPMNSVASWSSRRHKRITSVDVHTYKAEQAPRAARLEAVLCDEGGGGCEDQRGLIEGGGVNRQL